MPIRHREPILLALAATGLVAGCGAGTAGIVAGSSGGGGGATPALEAFEVANPKVSPCRLQLKANQTVRVELFYELDGDERPMTLLPDPLVTGNEVELSASPADVGWDFAQDLPTTGFRPDVRLVARRGGALVSGGELTLGIGNDAPELLSIDRIDIDPVAGEASGTTGIQLTVADSSADVISVRIEFDVQDDEPDLGWQLARPALADSTPDEGIQDVQVSEGGTALTFFWDADTDLPQLERNVRLRFTPTDGFLEGAPVESTPFRVDNNATPVLQLDTGPLLVNPDERRGIPVPYRVIDPEGDRVEVVFQWRLEGEEFPELPSDVAALDALLADPEQRRQKHVCTPFPRHARGRAVTVDASTLRLPELAASESWILAGGLEESTLELLRPSSIPRAVSWPVSPIAALPFGDGRTALVLDQPGNGRLRELELATGAVEAATLGQGIALGQGIPSAMALERGGAAVLLALEDAGTWRIQRVELSTGTSTTLLDSDGSEPAPVRGIASLGTEALLFTAGSSLFVLDYRDPLAPRSGKLLTGLAAPWGVAVDPFLPQRAYLSERDADRVLAIALDASAGLPAVVRTEDLEPGTLEAPQALALERNGSRLLVVTTGPGGGRQLVGLELGATGENRSFPIGEETVADPTSLATGSDGLRLVCQAGTLLVGGGIEQRRRITAYVPSSCEVSVEPAFDPLPGSGQPWRVDGSERRSVRASAQGVASTFLWDSGDAALAGPVFLRATAHDEEFSIPVDGAAPKNVRAALDVDAGVDPLTLGLGTTDYPFAVLAADLDQDGDLDIVSANLGTDAHVNGEPQCPGAGGDNLALFFQNAAGRYDGAPLLLGDSLTTDGPRAVAAADLDGDGAIDLVSANLCGNDLALFFQERNAPGSFEPPLTLGGATVTDGPASVAAADLDGDGDLDLVCANVNPTPTGSNLVIFLQGPPRSFADVRTLGGPGITDQPVSVVAADLDADGRLDLVCADSFGGSRLASSFDGNLAVFLQDPSVPGCFLDPILLGSAETMKSPRSVVAADLDGDGDLDLASANRRGDDLTVFFQLSPGTFETLPHTLGGQGFTNQPASITAADVDGDGDQDLLSANIASDSVTVFFQDAPGVFGARPLALGSPTATFSVTSVAAADLDGDGDVDLVTANDLNDGAGQLGGPGDLAVFHQFTPGGFGAAPLTLGGTGGTPTPSSPTAVDLDGDGDLDLVCAEQGGDALLVFSQLAPGRFSESPFAIGGPRAMENPFTVASADLDGDGDQDLASANLTSDDVTVFLQEPSAPGGFAAPLVLTSPGMNTPRCVTAVDLDHDGALELVSANVDSDDVALFFLDGRPPRTLTYPENDGAAWVVGADLDTDGHQDLVVVNRGSNRVTVFFQDPLQPEPFGAPLVLGNFTNRDVTSVAVADLEGDGDLDFVTANRVGNTVTTFLQGSPRSFTGPDTIAGSPVTDTPGSVAVADLDGDGDLDIVFGNQDSFELKVLFQLTPGGFGGTPLTLSSGGARPISVTAADLDGDGDPDLVLANFNTTSTRGNLRILFGGH